MAVKKRNIKDKKGNVSIRYVVDYIDINGKRNRAKFKLLSEARAYDAEVVSATNKGFNTSFNKTITFNDASEQFIEFNTKVHCKQSTIETYETYLKIHLKPFFKDTKMINITPQMVREFIKYLKDNTNLSNNSINKNIALLRSIIQKQIDEGALFLNPVDKVKKLKVEIKERKALNSDEVKKLLEVCKKYDKDFYPMLVTAIFTGMRRGEILALTWDKINFTTKEISIDRNLYKGQFVTPKTKTSKRKIKMSPELIKVIREWQLKSKPNDNNFVFCNESGNSIDPRNLVRRRFEPIVEKAGLGKVCWHSLRHTFASYLINKNVPTKYIQSQLGHSSIKMTIDIYGHLFPETCEQGTKALDDLLLINNNELKEAI